MRGCPPLTLFAHHAYGVLILGLLSAPHNTMTPTRVKVEGQRHGALKITYNKFMGKVCKILLSLLIMNSSTVFTITEEAEKQQQTHTHTQNKNKNKTKQNNNQNPL